MQMMQSEGDILQRGGVKHEKGNVVQSGLGMADPRAGAGDDGTNHGRPC